MCNGKQTRHTWYQVTPLYWLFRCESGIWTKSSLWKFSGQVCTQCECTHWIYTKEELLKTWLSTRFQSCLKTYLKTYYSAPHWSVWWLTVYQLSRIFHGDWTKNVRGVRGINTLLYSCVTMKFLQVNKILMNIWKFYAEVSIDLWVAKEWSVKRWNIHEKFNLQSFYDHGY